MLQNVLVIWLEATLFVQPTSQRGRGGNRNALTATVFIHIDQAVQDACAISFLLEDSGDLEAV